MQKDFLTIGGKEYRVEVNWHAVSEFLKSVGRDTLDGLAGFTSIKPSELPELMAAAINEGEALEGRECHLTAKDIASTRDMSIMGKFLEIYVQQSRPQVADEEPKKAPGEE